MKKQQLKACAILFGPKFAKWAANKPERADRYIVSLRALAKAMRKPSRKLSTRRAVAAALRLV